jgi:chromosome segregation ATPase
MPEEPRITMTEFKTVVEDFKSERKKMTEFMLHLDQKMDAGFRRMDDRFANVDRRFDDVSKRFNDVNKRFDDVDKRFNDVDKRFDDVDKRFDDVDRHFGKVDADISSLKQQVALLHEGQTEIKFELRRKADYEDFAKLEKRVARLERKTA